MNLFDKLVTQALNHQPNYSSLRVVVEKELLHHDILRILSQNNFLTELTFIGGTCLRSCYGGVRLSEDLDFTGGINFTRASLADMSDILIESLKRKYGLVVKISEPQKDIKNVDTWKIKVETRPKQKDIPAQRINIDICAVTSYEKQPMLLLNPYNVDMGTAGLIIQAQSREEIYADKLLAFALRPNRIKFRDIWDMVWLHQQGLKPNFQLLPNKLNDRNLSMQYFKELYSKRCESLYTARNLQNDFKQEMRRFLPTQQYRETIEQQPYWEFIVFLIKDLGRSCGLLAG